MNKLENVQEFGLSKAVVPTQIVSNFISFSFTKFFLISIFIKRIDQIS